jgi:hypothetical protein
MFRPEVRARNLVNIMSPLAVSLRKVHFSCFGDHPYLESRLTFQEKWVLDPLASRNGTP